MNRENFSLTQVERRRIQPLFPLAIVRRAIVIGWLLLCANDVSPLLPPLCAAEAPQEPQFFLGTARYRNRVYTQPPTSPATQAKAVSIFNGSGPSETPASDGVYTLKRSGVGQAVETQFLQKPDFKFGEVVTPPPGVDISRPPLIDPASKIIYVGGTNPRLIATEPGFVSVTWKDAAGANRPVERYLIASTAVKSPVRAFWTEGTTAPKIAFGGIDVTLAYNTSLDVNSVWVTGGLLHAKEKTGLIVAVYMTNGQYLDHELISVNSFEPDYTPDAPIGTFLAAESVPVGSIIPPIVTRGLDVTHERYAIQFDHAGDANEGKVMAVRPTSSLEQFEVFWMEQRAQGIRWPFEMARYMAVWPANFQSVSRRIYWNIDATGAATTSPGVEISASTAPEVKFHYNPQIPADIDNNSNTTTPALGFRPNERVLQAQPRAGRILIHYEAVSNQGNPEQSLFLGVQLVEVVPNSPDIVDATTIGSQLLPKLSPSDGQLNAAHVGRGLTGEPPYVYQHSAAGPRKGHAWAVRRTTSSDQIEVFWRREGFLGVLWPYEMHRYVADWPGNSQFFARGHTANALGPKVPIPDALQPTLMAWQEPFGHAFLEGRDFNTTRAGKSLLRYFPRLENGTDDVVFEVIESVLHTDPRVVSAPGTSPIGEEIVDGYHTRGAAPSDRGGYIHVASDSATREDRYAPAIYASADGNVRTGQIFPVNEGTLEIWWSNVKNGVQWPSRVKRYQAVWPATSAQIVIASQLGAGVINTAVHPDYTVYVQNDPALPGFNPNDEHAWVADSEGGRAVFALRSDLGRNHTSKPYVLMQHHQPGAGGLWRFKIFQVIPETTQYPFRYSGMAGDLIQSPTPINKLTASDRNTGVGGPYWRDRKGSYWAKAAGDNGGNATIVMHWFYPARDDFYFPEAPADRSAIPWLDAYAGTPGVPVNVAYNIAWPTAATLRVGETLVRAKSGLPEILGQCSARILYQQSLQQTPGRNSARLIHPLQTRSVDLASIPGDVTTERISGKSVFTKLPPPLQQRLTYDPTNKKLQFRGVFVEPAGGEAYVLPNVITRRELDETLLNPEFCGANAAFRTALQNLANICAEAIEATPASVDSEMALVSDSSGGQGYVTLVFGDGPGCAVNAPIGLKVIRVECPLSRSELAAIPSDSPFDEKISMRFKGDFAGQSDDYQFEWKTLPAVGGGSPQVGPEQWNPFPVANEGSGVNDIHIKGPGRFTLSDNWFICRYRPLNGATECSEWSVWTAPQLAEGWIKRVTARINSFNQRFDDLSSTERTINTIVNMIAQAGKRWEGDVPLDPAVVDKLGLIEIYETVFKRGVGLSIEGTPPMNDPGANDALLLATTKLADLYMLLGNEAYADATDPTIGIGSGEDYVQPASSLHSFMNQTPSLLAEELALLRGRDDSIEPTVETPPFYNRMIWNFSRGDGAVAYALNYAIQDQLGNKDGKIDEADAKIMYPQGHGDAWGHYLTAIKNYYRLLRSQYFNWVPHAEQILIGGVPVTVDYLDERKFARAAAAKARTGAELVGLTYRSVYDENPANQWQGYKDKTPIRRSRQIAATEPRSWGLSDWAIRAGQGTLLDWVTANAILPPVDSEHTDIRKVDRTSVTELTEIASHYQEIQSQMDKADVGLNPLGLAKNVVPFDIDPQQIDQGRTHFEQIYDRTVQALNNAIVVFNDAHNTTQLLRRQADELASFNTSVAERAADFNSRLIETFGTPYPEDIGPAGEYPSGYTGPDLRHFMYVDPGQLTGTPGGPMQSAAVRLFEPTIQADGGIAFAERTVTYHFSEDGYGQIKPANWTMRNSPGEVQLARSDLIQSKFRFDQALLQYENLYLQILDTQGLLQQQFNVNDSEIQILNTVKGRQMTLNQSIKAATQRQLNFRRIGRAAEIVANAIAEALPQNFVAGLATGGDFTSPARSAIRLSGAMVSEGMNFAADQATMDETDYNQAKELAQTQSSIDITALHGEQAIEQHLAQLRQLIRQEASLRLEIYTLQEGMQQASARYLAVLARGDRLFQEFTRFRKDTAANVQRQRYKDMAFRIFRNDTLQKYRAQFDLAAAYVYMSARAFDYETELLDSDPKAGQAFLTAIVRTRAIGVINQGRPQTASGQGDAGLADPMARMSLNWESVLKGRLGFNNPQSQQTRFSLRHELFRIPRVARGDAAWRETLEGFRVPNILAIPEFRRNAIFVSERTVEPGLVIPFETSINFGQNFFGRPLAPGDSAYDPSHFATKVRSVGIWFGNYNATELSVTPNVYLIPVGLDILRSPSGDRSQIREWQIVDQAIPVPFPISSGQTQAANWIPSRDTLDGTFADIRQFSGFRAFHDSTFNANEFTKNSRLIGRSVWNTRWLLVIPAGTLHSDRQEALDRFIHGKLVNGQRDGQGVKDLLLYFQTYAYSGN